MLIYDKINLTTLYYTLLTIIRGLLMKANLGTIKEHLNSEEDILSTLYCVINFGYISRSGILAATNKRLLFCSDAMFGKGLKWEFKYTEIEDFSHTDGVVLEMSVIPFIKK